MPLNLLDLRGGIKFRSHYSGMSSAMSLIILTIILTCDSDSASWNLDEYKCLFAFPMKIRTCASIVSCVPGCHQHVVMTSYFNIGKIFAHLYVSFNVPTTWCASACHKNDLARKSRYSVPRNRVPITITLNVIHVMYAHAVPLISRDTIS